MASGPAGSKVDSSAPSRKKQHKDGGSQSAHTPRFCNGSSPSSAAPRPRPKGQTSRPPAPQYPFIPLKLFSSYLTPPPAFGHCNMQYNVFFSGKNSFFLSLTKHLPLKLTLNHSQGLFHFESVLCRVLFITFYYFQQYVFYQCASFVTFLKTRLNSSLLPYCWRTCMSLTSWGKKAKWN